MADERNTYAQRHVITMESREKLIVTGVIDVISFDEEAVICNTSMGILIVRGLNLHIERLTLDSGELHIDGDIDVVMYEEERLFTASKGSFFSKIFK